MELAMGRRPRDLMDSSFHESRRADIHTNQTGPTQWRNSKMDNENTYKGPTTRRHSTTSFWRNEICSSRFKSRRTNVLLARRSEQNSARTTIWKMVQSGDSCCQRSHGCYQYWCVHVTSKCKQTQKTFEHGGSGRTSRSAWADKSTCVMAFLWGPNRCLGIVSDNSCFSAILHLTRTDGCSTSRPKNKKSYRFLTTGTTELLFKD